ncbi:uncharacterized protein LOC103317421 isoform X1 [Nasonia vitripennis]|uniref:THAP-type domain-containing protein n=1 Tax=Nasonia vitripennis TaxID=7425 RepID=A0A7M7IW90_NASVI|nr:uncharacterized protein LOC103317421 isoform X1 [Nasonia vitripennis]
MVRRCCVVTCRNSRSENCDERVSFFKVPSDQNLLDKWLKAVKERASAGDTILERSSSICERHFRDEDIRREATLKDSFGNVIFQRPLIKFSLVKDAVPSIFEEDLEKSSIRKRRKRKAPKDPENSNDGAQPNFQGNFILSNDGNLNVNYSNILVTFNENQSNLVNFNVAPSNNSQSEVIPITVRNGAQNALSNLDNINGTFDATAYFVNGQVNSYNNGYDITSQNKDSQVSEKTGTGESNQPKIISIQYLKPQEHFTDLSNISREQIQNHHSNFKGLNAPKEVTIIVPQEELMILNESNNYAHNKNTQKTVNRQVKNTNSKTPAPPKGGTLHYPLPESEAQLNIRAFDLIFHNSHKIKLPNAMWGYHKNCIDKDIIIFSKAKWFKSDVLIPPIYEKQVIFHESDNIKIYINNKFSPLEVRRPKDVQEMEVILKHVDETVVCSGGPNIGECDTAQCAQKDYAVNRWRHKLCPIIIGEAETICKFCSTINQVLRYPKKKRLPFGRRPPPDVVQEDS